MNICVYGASSDLIDDEYIKSGELLGETIAKHGHQLVFGGGACGMMGAVARGTKRAGGRIIGVCPRFLNVDGALFDGCDEMILTNDMAERKSTLESLADAFIITPGSVGTFDEFFQCLVLKQLGQHAKPIAVLNISGFFDTMLKMLNQAVDKRFMSAPSLELFTVEATTERIIDYCESCMDKLQIRM